MTFVYDDGCGRRSFKDNTVLVPEKSPQTQPQLLTVVNNVSSKTFVRVPKLNTPITFVVVSFCQS